MTGGPAQTQGASQGSGYTQVSLRNPRSEVSYCRRVAVACGLCRLLYGVVQASSSITRALFRGYVLVQLLVSGVLIREHLSKIAKRKLGGRGGAAAAKPKGTKKTANTRCEAAGQGAPHRPPRNRQAFSIHVLYYTSLHK